MTNFNNQDLIDLYNNLSLDISNITWEEESKDYHACRFKLNNQLIISRKAKITPKKVGQFVTFWKRDQGQPIRPFHEKDNLDFFVINVQNDKQLGQFVFPKSVLIQKAILSTGSKEGKRGFRVYPIWDTPISKTAEKTQTWQLKYFIKIDEQTCEKKIMELYHLK
ncbi:MepB family protein [Flammeovirga yaeyamensis]|uniref:MepB family protein n=1 Tax=Flammeovirga yaeyamensis TaxID=367791 RepID=A0AAX1NBD3_9BACT|nr:MepB family protein [Flammeovirga yaeyamensis]MBB3697223.1 hypothetical protein [Flammeovirga yaeyamensis]NMF33882.1 MepB family protein [Flammeovirga yaeyamensis]QWG04858.1 MepB family protein [Flammeovirga yaeyamensis]